MNYRTSAEVVSALLRKEFPGLTFFVADAGNAVTLKLAESSAAVTEWLEAKGFVLERWVLGYVIHGRRR